MTEINRCFANKPGQDLYADYHDHEWGKPCFDDKYLFEMLILEGAQAGLNWQTILKKRMNYRNAFYNFDVCRVAMMKDDELEGLCADSGIIRNRLKIIAARNNARVFISIQQAFGSFANYLWQFVDNQVVNNQWQRLEEVPVQTETSIRLSKDLKKRGMSFVGPTIMYAYMQAVGLVNDHLLSCDYK